MNKKVIVTIIIVVAVILICGISIGFGDKFFFTTKYYKNPVEAYNADCSYDPVFGDATAEKGIGVVSLDDNTALFLGSLNETDFVIGEMAVKNNKYAFKGNSSIYSLSEDSNIYAEASTRTSNGYISWSVAYSQEEVNKASNVDFVKSFTHPSGKVIHLIVYK